MKRFLLYLSALFLSVSFATAQTTYEISTSTGSLTGGTNPSYEWVSNQVDLTLRATNDGGDAKNISYISNGTKLSLNAYNSKGACYTTTYTISVPQDGNYKIAGYNIDATAYKTVIVNGVEYTNGSKVAVAVDNVNGYTVSFVVERKRDDRNSTAAAAIDVNSFTVTLQEASEGEGGEEPGDDSTIMEQYAAIAKPTFGKAGNTTFVKAATLAGDVNAEVAGIQAVAGQACVTNVIEVAAGAEFDLNITYKLNWGDLAIYQIENGEATKEYGYYEGSWELNGSTAKVAQNIAEDGISVTEVVDEVCTATFPISISANHNPGDIVVVRAITGVMNNATNSAYEQGISEGGYVDFLFVVTEEVAPKSYTLAVGETGWATLFLGFNAAIPSNVIKAYTVTAVNDGYVTLTQVTGVLPAETGVIVNATKGNYEFNYSAENVADVAGNLLKGSVADENIEGEAYVLGVVDGAVGLYKAEAAGTSWKNNANKAYLPASVASGAASYSFRFGEGTTGVEKVEMRNEKSEIYDLTGRRVEKVTAPGIYIVGGKKVLVK